MSYRVLHVLDHSWPVLDGYSHRSHSLISAQKGLGWDPLVLTSPLHNLDDPAAADTMLDSVPYFRVPDAPGLRWQAIRNRWPLLREWAVVTLLEKRISALIREQKIDLVHAHSPALCGLAAARAAHSQGVPFIYEIRSFWEDGTTQSPNSPRYRLARSLETHVVLRADAVVAIAAPIVQDLVSRGAPAAKMFHVPNGVDAARFTPRSRDAALAEQLGVSNIPVLGFIGTLFPWEGVAWMVSAAAALHSRGIRFKLLIVGDGAEAEPIRQAIVRENATEYVSYLGRVPHQEVERYYSVMDVLAYPRHSLRITEFVTPLKPLEAMAFGKATLGSAVGGIRELITPEETGLLFEPGNIEDFCRQATRLLQDETLRHKLGEQARKNVCSEKDWKSITARYAQVYDTAAENFRRKKVPR